MAPRDGRSNQVPLFAAVAMYALGSGGLMWINTSLLGLADPALGPSGWVLYWPFWAGMIYGPLVGSMVLFHLFRAPLRWPVIAPLAFTVLLLATMEARFVTDARMRSLLIDYPALALCLILLFRPARAAKQPTDTNEASRFPIDT